MPRLISEQVVTLEMADLDRRVPIRRPEHTLERAKGAHQSDILRYIAHKIGKLKPGERDEGEYPTLWALGAAWEEFIVSFFPDMDWQPGELTVDGISVNADGIMSTDDGPVLEECKFTFKGVRTGEEWLDEWLYQHQARAYCYCYGTRVVRWHVCHVRGDYKSFGPVYKRYVVEFSDVEVVQTWKMLTLGLAEMRAKGLIA